MKTFEEIIVQNFHKYSGISPLGKYVQLEVYFGCNAIANNSFFCITVAYAFLFLHKNVIHVPQNYNHMTCWVFFREMV